MQMVNEYQERDKRKEEIAKNIQIEKYSKYRLQHLDTIHWAAVIVETLLKDFPEWTFNIIYKPLPSFQLLNEKGRTTVPKKNKKF